MVFPAVPTPQAVNSKTYLAPPVDGTLTAPEYFDFNAKHNPSYPFFVYEDAPSKLVHVNWSQVQRGVYRAQRFAEESIKSVTPTSTRIVAILALADTMTYFTLNHGLIRAGFHPFPISPRNSPAAIAHLLSKTKADFLFVSGDPSMTGLSGASLKALAANGGHDVQILPMPNFDMFYAPREDDNTPVPPAAKPDLNSTAMLLHSSGSTSFPKPIYITHRILLEWVRIPHYGEIDCCGEIFGAAATPNFHALGVISAVSMLAAGGTLSVFKPVERPTLPTPEQVLNSIIATSSTLVFSVPSFIEAWSQNPASIEPLKKLRALMSSGGPLSQVVGDALAAEGVPIIQVYGITELGCPSAFIPADIVPEDWQYWKVSGQLNYHLDPQPDNEGYEFQVLPCDTHTPAVLNIKIDGRDAYATSDLVVEHPTRKGYFKVHGRVDDQIMLSTGEKTNPGPLEAIISKDARIAGSVMFGRGRFQNGIVIEPAKDYLFDVEDDAKRAEYIDAIWPSVELANTYAPSHSRLLKPMILIAKPSKPFTFTGKGSIKKSAVVASYEEEIEAIYQGFEKASSADVAAPAEWTPEATLEFVRKVVIQVLEDEIEDNADIFQQGGDSLQATFMRNTIVNALKSSDIDTTGIPANFVYSSPTISQLAAAVNDIINPSSVSASEKLATKLAEIEAFVAKYTANFPVHNPTAAAPTSEVIVLTGSTGGLGTTLLAQLVERPTVSKIYAINRKSSGKSLKDRQVAALVDRGYDAEVASSDKVVLLEGDTTASGLGLSVEQYNEIRDSATSIIHNAWRVDFNLSLASFDPLLKGLRNLVDIALQSPLPSPPRVLFASSVSVFSNWHSEQPAEERFITDPFMAVGGGYGESKYVAERILDGAARTTPLKPIVVRIGQLSGGKNGSWNTSEWLPSVVRSGEVVGCLPASDDAVSWLPLTAAAAAIVDFQSSPNTPQTVHLVHPRAVSWTTIFTPIAKSLGVPLVPYAEWLARLEKNLADPSRSSVEAVKENPALLLIDMFRPYVEGATGNEARDALGVPQLATVEAQRASSALSVENLPVLGQSDAEGWLAYWRKAGLLRTTGA